MYCIANVLMRLKKSLVENAYDKKNFPQVEFDVWGFIKFFELSE